MTLGMLLTILFWVVVAAFVVAIAALAILALIFWAEIKDKNRWRN